MRWKRCSGRNKHSMLTCSSIKVDTTSGETLNYKQVYSAVNLRYSGEQGDWVCRIFGILMVFHPEGVDIKLICACMDRKSVFKSYLPYPVYKHYTQYFVEGGRRKKEAPLYVLDVNDIIDTVALIPVQYDAGGDYWDSGDFSNAEDLQHKLYYCLTPDRFTYPRAEGVDAEIDECDIKPRNRRPTFLPLADITKIEKKHGLGCDRSDRKYLDDNGDGGDEGEDDDDSDEDEDDDDSDEGADDDDDD